MHELRDATISVVIIDDEALVRQGLTLILEAADDIRVVGVGDSGAAADLVSTHRPSVVLLDIRMPAPDGLTVLRHLRTLPDPPQVVMLTTFDMDDTVRTALELGAAGYLLKDTDPEHLPHFVRTAAAGGVVLAGSPAHRMRTAIRAGGADPEAAALVDTLTDREVSVLRQLARGDSNAEIARALHLSQGTVKDHVSAILAKLRVTGRVPAALIAARADILTAEPTR
ncbi:two-component system response regulator [Leucobacter sp. 7(1)]|uniref:response regulator n=1 Tax=Leucobacter sp. 7(1) TaxID=1255613 RepID=UPI00097F6B6F|nr:response regulator transcription factor [Leucobacter sp. 7(1)]SJN10230.1 two-component system response regulator [Leucobacter sp. 7(1)]